MSDTYLTLSFGSEVTPAIGGVSQLATDLATLVADGATPTQAHVNTVANDWCALTGGNAAATASITQAGLLIVIDKTVIPTVSVLQGFFNLALRLARAQGLPQ